MDSNQPLVSVIICSYNRPKIVHEALRSIALQTYTNHQTILVRDGGVPIGNIPSGIEYVDRGEHLGPAASFNQGIARAKGKYICYIGDDDIWYPEHIETLVKEAEKSGPEYLLWYTDLYRTYYRPMGDERVPVTKKIEVCREPDIWVELFYNQVLGSSMMHRRDVLQKTGLINEKLTSLCDYDLTHKMIFFGRFKHIEVITGEYYSQIDGSDRISDKKIGDPKRALKDLLMVRTARPLKPWVIPDLAIVVEPDIIDDRFNQLLIEIDVHATWPHEIFVVSDSEQLKNIKYDLIFSSIRPVVKNKTSLELILLQTLAEYIAYLENDCYIPPDSISFFERPLASAMQFQKNLFRLAGGYIGHRQIFENENHRNAIIREPVKEFWPLKFDHLLTAAERLKAAGEWVTVELLYQHIIKTFNTNVLWLNRLRVEAFYKAGKFREAIYLAKQIRSRRDDAETFEYQIKAEKELKKGCLNVETSDLFTEFDQMNVDLDLTGFEQKEIEDINDRTEKRNRNLPG